MFLIQLVGEMLVLMSRTLHLHHLLKQGLRLWWRLESSLWLCDTEIYSTGFQGGLDSFHLCHSIPPGLSHLLLWHSLKAWPQKRTLWTMGLFPYSAFSDPLNSCSSILQLLLSPPSQAPRSQASWEFTLNICLMHRSPTSLCCPPPLLKVTLAPSLAHWLVPAVALLHICVPEGHL